ncbi:hypothetical protein FV220_12465 [Methylobacterium sp. WL19]|nr:hypothetical protein FV220_12465 [Methylobacterium sp. WL19]
MKKPAHRGATASFSNAFRQVSVENYALEPRSLQAERLARRYGLTLAAAAVVAELAFAVPETWGSRA